MNIVLDDPDGCLTILESCSTVRQQVSSQLPAGRNWCAQTDSTLLWIGPALESVQQGRGTTVEVCGEQSGL